MNTEEKAKAYDEAIEKAKEIKEKIMYSHLSTESCKAVSEYIDTIIPELRESEDERIRKKLIETIGYFRSRGIDQQLCEEFLTYLEKEKEQKQISWSELTWKDINTLERLINNVRYEFQNGISEESFGKAVLERFRESKGDDYVDDVEWSEEDGKLMRLIISILKNKLPDKFYRSDEMESGVYVEELVDFLNKVRKSFSKFISDGSNLFSTQITNEYRDTTPNARRD